MRLRKKDGKFKAITSENENLRIRPNPEMMQAKAIRLEDGARQQRESRDATI